MILGDANVKETEGELGGEGVTLAAIRRRLELAVVDQELVYGIVKLSMPNVDCWVIVCGVVAAMNDVHSALGISAIGEGKFEGEISAWVGELAFWEKELA